jgi:hypothetical protein
MIASRGSVTLLDIVVKEQVAKCVHVVERFDLAFYRNSNSTFSPPKTWQHQRRQQQHPTN